ncbi:MAG TPA: LacI family DNA-binding transcriptional regulator, partial [Propionibacteriaceae bacterium]
MPTTRGPQETWPRNLSYARRYDGRATMSDASGVPANARPATRDDVARYAGVSTAVVSYVINNGPRRVAPETAARVRAA